MHCRRTGVRLILQYMYMLLLMFSLVFASSMVCFIMKNLLEPKPMKISRVLKSGGKKLQLVSHIVCRRRSATNSTYPSNLHQGTQVHFFFQALKNLKLNTDLRTNQQKRRNIFVTYVNGVIIKGGSYSWFQFYMLINIEDSSSSYISENIKMQRFQETNAVIQLKLYSNFMK